MRKIAKPIIELSGINHITKKAAVERFSLSLPTGDTYAVLHKSPQDISMLIDIIAGKQPKSGKIFFRGDDITGTKNSFGVIRSSSSLPKKTVCDFASSIIIRRGLSRATTDVLVRKELTGFGLSESADKNIAKLDAEQAEQAVVFGAYMCSHELIVIDEPFARLEEKERLHMIEWLDKLRHDKNVSLLIFTENLATALALSDCVMTVGKGCESKGIIAVDKKKERAEEKLRELYDSL